MKPRESVYERTKRMGFIAGPNNRMARARDMAEQASPKPAPAPKEDGGESDGPPNLRDAQETIDTCADCVHFKPSEGEEETAQCAKFKCPVKSYEICDDYSDGADEKGFELGEDDGGGE